MAKSDSEDDKSRKKGKRSKSTSKKKQDRFADSWSRYRQEMARYKREQKRRSIEIPWKKIGIGAGIVLIIGVVVFALLSVPPIPEAEEDDRAPNFTLTNYDGTRFTLYDFEGQIVLLDFMETYCTPCIEGIPDLREVSDAFPDLVIISVSVARESSSVLETFAQTHNIDWYLAPDTAQQNVAGKYGIRATPTLVLLDYEQRIVKTHVGLTSASVLIDDINGVPSPGFRSVAGFVWTTEVSVHLTFCEYGRCNVK